MLLKYLPHEYQRGLTKIQTFEDDQKIIQYSRKLLPFDKGKTWIKKERESFDEAMGCLQWYGSMGTWSEFGLYRVKGLSAIFRKKRGTPFEKVENKSQKG